MTCNGLAIPPQAIQSCPTHSKAAGLGNQNPANTIPRETGINSTTETAAKGQGGITPGQLVTGAHVASLGEGAGKDSVFLSLGQVAGLGQDAANANTFDPFCRGCQQPQGQALAA